MNRAKWNNSRIPLPILAAKFAEEAGEVAGAIADLFAGMQIENMSISALGKHRGAIQAEISDARFMLGLIEERIGSGSRAGETIR